MSATGRGSHEHDHLRHEFSVVEIAAAVSRVTGVSPDHPALIRVSLQMRDDLRTNPQLQNGGLGDENVRAYVNANMTPDLKQQIEVTRKAEAADQRQTAQELAAIYGAAARGAFSAFGAAGGRAEAQAAAANDSVSVRRSSAAFESFLLNDPASWNTPQGLLALGARARALGIGWAAERPEILSLGPEAVKALADVQFREDSYKRITTDGGFKAKDVVDLSKYAKEKNVDANEAAGAIADANKGLSPEEKRRHNDALTGVFRAKPEEAEAAKQRLLDVQKELSRDKPEREKRFEKANDKLKISKEKRDVAVEQRKTAEHKADTKEQRKAATLNALTDDAPAKPASKPAQKQRVASAQPK